MSMYSQKSSWKIILVLIGISILLITVYYANYLATELEKKELREVELKSLATDLMLAQDDTNLNDSLPLIDKILLTDKGIPTITEDESGNLEGSFWGDDLDTNKVFLQRKVEEFIKSGKEPMSGYGYTHRIYYFNTPLLQRIRLFPLAQIGLVGLFLGLGYYLFSQSRISEQNRIWAGMAKETAHQLGTPISAIIAWIEHLKLTAEGNAEQVEIVDELRDDVRRLELIADRFSKIGSKPELEKVNIYRELADNKQYMMRRSPKRVMYDFPDIDATPLYVNINRHLFDWVIENLMRNALDAMDREGRITAYVYSENNYVCIDLSDTGKGMSSSITKKVFEPGFSTKKRGWGLGLSLSRRIIKDYHKGKIYVKSSKVNEGTTFTIKLPKAD